MARRDGEGKLPVASRRVERDPQIFGERLGAFALRTRHFLGLIDAHKDGGARAARSLAQQLALGVDGVVEREKASSRQLAFVITRGLRPGVEQPVADHSNSFAAAIIGKGTRQRFRKVEERIGAGTEGAERQKGRSLASEAGNDPGSQQRRLAGAGGAENDERAPVALGAHLAQLFERMRDLARAAIEQGRVGILIAERGKTRKRRGPQLGVGGKSLGIEPNAGVGAGRAQPCLERARGVRVGVNIQAALRIDARQEINALILAPHPVEPALGLGAQAGGRRQEEERHDPLSHVPGGFELTETLARRKPMFSNQTQDDPACAGSRTQRLAPFIPARYAVMIDKNIGEAIGFEPCLERAN
jgi:hypothetical protein